MFSTDAYKLASPHDGSGDKVLTPPHLPQAVEPSAWWYALEEPNGLGVHHVELGGDALEFVSVSYRNDRPTSDGTS
jgi:hypothetical protein